MRPLFCATLLCTCLALVPQARAADPRSVPYLTIRNVTGDPRPSEFYGEDRGGLRAGTCRISGTGGDLLKPLAESAPFYIPDEIVRLERVEEAPGEAFLDSFVETNAGRAPLLHLHGAFVGFSRSCRRAAQIQQSLDLTGRLLLLSWPADASPLSYTLDEADLRWSVLHIENVIRDLTTRFGPGRLNLSGHSLGARGVFLALAGLAHEHDGGAPWLGNVVLFAPDIDFDIFAQYLPRIRPLARSITIYVSGNDLPLALSAELHGRPRLGQTGNNTARLKGVEIIDLTAIPQRSASGHVYHLYNPQAAADMTRLLRDNQTAEHRPNLIQARPNLWRLRPLEEE